MGYIEVSIFGPVKKDERFQGKQSVTMVHSLLS